MKKHRKSSNTGNPRKDSTNHEENKTGGKRSFAEGALRHRKDVEVQPSQEKTEISSGQPREAFCFFGGDQILIMREKGGISPSTELEGRFGDPSCHITNATQQENKNRNPLTLIRRQTVIGGGQ